MDKTIKGLFCPTFGKKRRGGMDKFEHARICKKKMAEREGFEPSKAFTPYTLSKRARSTTLPPLREMVATHPALPKARRRCYRCSLPGLAEFTTCRLQGTKMGHHRGQNAKGKGH